MTNEWLVKRVLDRIGMSQVSQIQRLYERGTTSVFRICGSAYGLSSLILKISKDVEAATREFEVHNQVVRNLSIPHPRLVAAEVPGEVSWLLYTDDFLQPVAWNVYRMRQTVTALAGLHTLSLPRHDVGMTSHTPQLRAVLQDVQQFDWEPVWRRDDPEWTKRELSNCNGMLRAAPAWVASLETMPKVICHGDLHLGNVLWPKGKGRPFFIDWEFIHMDHAYFDLFQLLDATSPFTPLGRPVSRLTALRAYAKAAGLTQREARGFIRGYLKYACIYLLWILTRIVEDERNGRHEASAIRRQFEETRWGLRSLANQLHLFH